ncbi:uncharacterized protein NPIL_540661 [Nephila pilipes]|uniref:Uncharacterized protein n=1 Tax=Nephila pilipes TaxID=299642 RepID=A0A8X6MZJ4_NEPPI|nr:uncharacterized protein NPIL_540661 [Nephila pilipes]
MFDYAPRVGLCTNPIPREVFHAVENEQQFENALTVLTACSKCEHDAVISKEASLNGTVDLPFQRYEDTSPNNTVKLYVVCLEKLRRQFNCCRCEQPHVSCSKVSYTEDNIEQKVCSYCLNKINREK